MGCLDTLIKYILFIFNFIFVIIGIGVIVTGAVLLADAGDFSDVLDEIGSGLKAPQITLIVIGSIIFVIAFLGCCGSIRKNKCMLIMYAILLLAIFIVQLAIGIYAAANFSSDGVNTVVDKIFKENTPESQDLFHGMERSLKCCGVNGPQDYSAIPMPIPSSCCAQDKVCNNPDDYFKVGCSPQLVDWLKDAGTILAGVAIGLSVVEIVGAIFAIIQARKTDRNLF